MDAIKALIDRLYPDAGWEKLKGNALLKVAKVLIDQGQYDAACDLIKSFKAEGTPQELAEYHFMQDPKARPFVDVDTELRAKHAVAETLCKQGKPQEALDLLRR